MEAMGEHDQRVQNTLDAIAANRALQKFMKSEGTDQNASKRFNDLMASNSTLVLQQSRPTWVRGPFVYQDVFDNFQEMRVRPEGRAAFAQGLEEIPEGISLIVVSRTDPPPEFATGSLRPLQIGVGIGGPGQALADEGALGSTAGERE